MRCPRCNKELSSDANFCTNCGYNFKSIQDVNNSNKNNSKELQSTGNSAVQRYADKDNFNEKRFISDLYYLETEQRVLENRIPQIERNIRSEKFIPQFEKTDYYKTYKSKYKEPPKEPTQGHTSYESGIDGLRIAIAGVILGGLWYAAVKIVNIILHYFITIPTWFYVAPGVLIVLGGIIYAINGTIKESEENATHRSRYKENMKKYEIDSDRIPKNNATYLQTAREDYDAYVKKRQKEIAKVIPPLEAELQEARNQLKNVRSCLSMLYSLRLNGEYCLHPNYQGLEPVSVIYGYFDTGRASQLRGHEGAYNLYADEVQKKVIMKGIDNLSTQMAKGFNQLNETMRYVGDAIDSCQNQLQELQSSSNSMIKQLKASNQAQANIQGQLSDISSSAINTEYYSKVAAEMTTLNTWYNILKD